MISGTTVFKYIVMKLLFTDISRTWDVDCDEISQQIIWLYMRKKQGVQQWKGEWIF